MELLRSSVTRNFKLYLSQSRRIHLLKNKAFVNHEWVSAQSNATFPIINPADDAVIAEVPDMEPVDVNNAIDAAANSFKTWKDVTQKTRSTILRKWFKLCEQNSDNLAKIITAETGKPLVESKGEVTYGNSYLEWFSSASRFINGEIIPSPWQGKKIMVTREPLGVVSIITPWNFPHAMITRKVGALMAAGCTCVIKPSEDAPLIALALAELAQQAGVPKGVINIVTSSRKYAPQVGEALCTHEKVACISFTGSTVVGKILYGHASKGIKKVSLELGGNAPFIVFPSADLDNALDHAMLAKFRNCGQACIGANRFLIHESIYDKFISGFKDRILQKSVLGNGMKEGVTCGPLINDVQAKSVSGLVDGAVKQGAEVVIGGEFATELGSRFYKPTILVNINANMTIWNTEIFGPVVQILKIKDEQEALNIANKTNCGLASYVFTRDISQAFRMSRNLEFGMVAINDGMLSAAEAPFGGIKEAGIGREGSLHGAVEYTELKYTLISGIDK